MMRVWQSFVLGLGIAFLLAVICPVARAQVTSDRIEALTNDHGYFPCMDCHGEQQTNVAPRILEEEHYEPMEWEDDAGVTHQVPFGNKVAIADLLNEDAATSIRAANLARIGARLDISSYMESNHLSPADSVWTIVHGGGNLWCLDCHDKDDRDKLRKLSGELLTFNESHLLCGGCHGPKLRDWEAGIHGKTVGYWNPEMADPGQTVKLLCVECHDSHRPAFAGMIPMPAPVPRVAGPGAHALRANAQADLAEEKAHE